MKKLGKGGGTILKEIIQQLEYKSFNKGEILYNQNQKCDGIYIIMKGRVNSFKLRFKEDIMNTKKD